MDIKLLITKTPGPMRGFEMIVYNATYVSNRLEIVRESGTKGASYATAKLLIKFKDGAELDIHEESESFLRYQYGLNLDINICINGRIKRCIGRFMTLAGMAGEIELSKDLLLYANKTEILDTLYHELVHYALFVKYGTGYRDGDELFENELKRLNITSNFS